MPRASTVRPRRGTTSWRPAAQAFESMKREKRPGVFWFHGEGLFHMSLSHKFHQKPVVALLRKIKPCALSLGSVIWMRPNWFTVFVVPLQSA